MNEFDIMQYWTGDSWVRNIEESLTYTSEELSEPNPLVETGDQNAFLNVYVGTK